jgi:A/G-specific adenine glycosylase
MLQQTQVSTVIDYYLRFIDRFPDVVTLAQASLDDVLALWTGLGYYARARNLYKSAQIIHQDYQGLMPNTSDELVSLPGIGRSTAGAIMALAHHQRCSILDGNVKRVLARYYAIEGWPGNKQIEQQLWTKADQLLPETRIAHYIQAQMDLGATVCTRRKPLCQQCPLQSDCLAYSLAKQHDFPTAKPKKAIPNKLTVWLIVQDTTGQILLEQRPNAGIWGGLWAFPETNNEENILYHCQNKLKIEPETIAKQATIDHVFSHFKLTISPFLINFSTNRLNIADNNRLAWYKIEDALQLGLPSPVKAFLKLLE